MTRYVAVALVAAGLLVGGWSVRALGEILDGGAGSLAPLAAADTAPPVAVAPAEERTTTTPRPVREQPAAAAIATRSARIGDLEDADRATPTRLRIPSLDVDADIGGVGVLADGSMEIPDDVDRLGWYRFGSAPDDAQGATVVTGHVDSRAQGAGAFFDLHGVDPGAQVEVDLSDGRTVDYTVVGRERIDKDALPTDEVFRRSGPPVLVLVTCGGEFDRTERSYADNVVVVAEPIS